MGDYWLTTLTSIRKRDPDWRAIAAYEGPVRRYLGRRFPALPQGEREDLLQDVLIAMKERIVPRYDPAAGSFRAFLSTAILNRVRDHLRKRKRAHPGLEPDTLTAPDEEELDALDLEALLVHAVEVVHDRFTQGPEADLDVVYVLSGVLVHGLSNKEIAKREGLSADQVKRRLQRARAAIVCEIFRELLGPESGTPERLARCAELTRACVRTPRKLTRLLERESDALARESVGQLVRRLQNARSSLGAGAQQDGAVDLMRGVETIFDGGR